MPAPPDPEDIIYEEEPAAHDVGVAKERDGANKSESDKAPGTESAQSDQTSDKEDSDKEEREEMERVKEEMEPDS